MNRNDQKWFLSRMKQAIQHYEMIQNNDHVAVALSGGKDSLVLLSILRELQLHSHLHFQLSAVHVDCGWPGQQIAPLEQVCSTLGVPFYTEPSCIAQAVVPNGTPVNNPCALCSRLRRGALLQWAESHQCNRIALGHHLDDFVETLFLNLLHGGMYEVYAPRIDYADRGISIIRPMVYVEEQTCIRLAERFSLHPVKNPCPVDHQTQRQTVKQLLATLRLTYPDLNRKLLHALEHTQPEQLWSVYRKTLGIE